MQRPARLRRLLSTDETLTAADGLCCQNKMPLSFSLSLSPSSGDCLRLLPRLSLSLSPCFPVTLRLSSSLSEDSSVSRLDCPQTMRQESEFALQLSSCLARRRRRRESRAAGNKTTARVSLSPSLTLTLPPVQPRWRGERERRRAVVPATRGP